VEAAVEVAALRATGPAPTIPKALAVSVCQRLLAVELSLVTLEAHATAVVVLAATSKLR